MWNLEILIMGVPSFSTLATVGVHAELANLEKRD